MPNRIIKAVRVRSPEDVKRAVEFSCDYLLLDTWHEQHYGGTGNVFDWSLVPKTIKPFFLAGGINSANIAQAIEKLSPYAVDVSSGLRPMDTRILQKSWRLCQGKENKGA